MKITVTNEEVKFLANIVILANQTDQAAPTPKEPDVGWRSWVTAPIAQHAINPGEAKAILTVIGILADYGVPFKDILKTILKNFVENYATCHDVEVAPENGGAWRSQKIEEALDVPESPLMRQNYSCNICGLKSFVTYSQREDEFDIAIKIREDHKEKEPTCPCPINDLNIVGDPAKA